MGAPSARKTRDVSVVFAALADPTRRKILERLTRGHATVGELAEPFNMSWPAVTKHVRVLETAGLVSRRHEGRTHCIHLNAQPMQRAHEWLERYHQFWSGSLDALANYLERGEGKQPPDSDQKSPPAS